MIIITRGIVRILDRVGPSGRENLREKEKRKKLIYGRFSTLFIRQTHDRFNFNNES